MRVILLGFILFAFGVKAQVVDTVVVDFTKSAYMVFTSADLKFDCGSEDVIVRVSGNKLILQAGIEAFEETNLFVEDGGKMYVFIVKYGDPKGKYLYNYANLKSSAGVNNRVVGAIDTLNTHKVGEFYQVNTEDKDSLNRTYELISDQLILKSDRTLNRGVVKYKLGIYLRDLVIVEDKIFMEFEVNNTSNIPYYIDFYNYRVKSVKKRIKGESVQEIELKPVLEYKRPEKIEGKSVVKYVIVMDKFVLTDNKKLVIEHWEDNGKDLNIEGGRKIDFDVFYKDILNVKTL
jgi:hypothetical protein